MDQQVDALVVTPVDYDGLKDSFKASLYRNRIPVIVVDTEVKHNKICDL